MQVAIFSDVHGNLTALQAVLADIDRRPDIDQVIFAGDLCLFGPRPLACLEIIQQRAIPGIVGNTDQWITTPPALADGLEVAVRQRIEQRRAVAAWTREALGPAGAAWLVDPQFMPFDRRISPTPYRQDDLLIVHANPHDVNQVIFPSEERQQTLYGRVRQTDEALEPLLRQVEAAVMAFGHLHIPGIRQWGDLTLANISSVSLPGDGDGRAKYGLLGWQAGGGWSVEQVHVNYEAAAEIEAFRRFRPPGWETAIEQLSRLGFVAQIV